MSFRVRDAFIQRGSRQIRADQEGNHTVIYQHPAKSQTVVQPQVAPPKKKKTKVVEVTDSDEEEEPVVVKPPKKEKKTKTKAEEKPVKAEVKHQSAIDLAAEMKNEREVTMESLGMPPEIKANTEDVKGMPKKKKKQVLELVE
jgi:hypothetical protein